MKKKKFIRTHGNRFSKLGKGRKKLQKWRKPKGRDNKMRERREGKAKNPSLGYKKSKKIVGRINGKKIELVRNVKELERVEKDSLVIIGKIGAKKKIDIVKKAIEMKLQLLNTRGGNRNGLR